MNTTLTLAWRGPELGGGECDDVRARRQPGGLQQRRRAVQDEHLLGDTRRRQRRRILTRTSEAVWTARSPVRNTPHYVLGATYYEADPLEHLGQSLAALQRRTEARLVWQQALRLNRVQERTTDADRIEQQLAVLDREEAVG
ncbi:hypothetical protein ACGFNU_00090 [Spirillospora sp. NPDC048911]|uniref:hypothetical protein n=1 Tax=Spirillospora sp. NPDC048911 TaxID=3364527 RepID=UPI00371D74C1